MIDDENHPQMVKAHHEIVERLGRILNTNRGKPLSRPIIENMFDAIKQHRDEWRARGVDFPVLVAIPLPRLGVVEFARADLDIASIRTKIVNVARFNPSVTKEELAVAFMTAYPDLKPGDIAHNRQQAIEAGKRQLERQKRIAEEVNQIYPGALKPPDETQH